MKKLKIELELTLDEALMEEDGVSATDILRHFHYGADDEVNGYIQNVEAKAMEEIPDDTPAMQQWLS